MDELGVDVSRQDDRAAVRLAGEVDTYTSPKLEAQLSALIEDGAQEIVVDLTDLEFMDSTGLTTLVRAQARLRPRGGRLLLESPRPSVQKILEMTGLENDFGNDVS